VFRARCEVSDSVDGLGQDGMRWEGKSGFCLMAALLFLLFLLFLLCFCSYFSVNGPVIPLCGFGRLGGLILQRCECLSREADCAD
jgi:hypothetical protein